MAPEIGRRVPGTGGERNEDRTLGQAVREAAGLLQGAGSETPVLDAEVLLGHVLGCSRAALVAGRRDPLPAAAGERFDQLVQRRLHGEPVAYLTGEREFWSIPFAVDPRVLVPRPETERLVELAIAHLRAAPPGGPAARVVDVGTGSGAIAVALARELGAAVRVVAIDLSAAALAVARRNVASRGDPRGREPWLVQGDLLACCASGAIDLVASNPPYLDDADLAARPRELEFEPLLALWGGPDGLDVVRRLVAEAARVLRPGGALLCEIGASQGAEAGRIATRQGFEDVRIERDLAGQDRVLLAIRAARAGGGTGWT